MPALSKFHLACCGQRADCESRDQLMTKITVFDMLVEESLSA